MNEAPDAKLDAALRAAFAPPPPEQFAALARQAAGPSPRGRIWPWLVAAAALLVVALLLLREPPARGPEGHDGHELGAMWAAAYDDAVAKGFGEVSCCQVGLDLPHACRERFACGFDVAHGSDVALLGTYSGRPTGGSMTLLARIGGAPVCVCVVPEQHDPRVALPKGSDLHLARREVGDLVLYALSKMPAPGALDAFVVP